MKTIYKFNTAGSCIGRISSTSEEDIFANIENIPSDKIYVIDENNYSWEDIYYKNNSIKIKPLATNNYSIWDIDTEQWLPDTDILKSQIIVKRNQLLIASDWTQLPDVPQITKDKWATYRQELRDITGQPGYPLNVVWPQQPQ